MKLKIFTLRLNPVTGLFDEGELVSFQLGKDVIEISEHFLVHEKTPTLLLVLRYRDIPDNGGGARQSQEAARKDWRAELDTQSQRIYDEFRLWRGRKAKQEGLPPYLILNNRELAELVMKHPANITQLREIEGIGEAKSKRWGEEMLALLSKLEIRKLAEPAPTTTKNQGENKS
jgi:ATP-dependent DNA helicase RecQ